MLFALIKLGTVKAVEPAETLKAKNDAIEACNKVYEEQGTLEKILCFIK
jgi:hypothetical protein